MDIQIIVDLRNQQAYKEWIVSWGYFRLKSILSELVNIFFVLNTFVG